MSKTHRLRIGRLSIQHQDYLITTVTHQRKPLFRDIDLARQVVRTLYSPQRQRFTVTLAYVLMPDHLHWLFTLKEGELESVMRQFKSYSAHVVNRHNGSTGPIWQKGYHDHALRTEEDRRAVARYLIANPLRKGIVEDVGDYAHWDAVWLESSLLEIT